MRLGLPFYALVLVSLIVVELLRYSVDSCKSSSALTSFGKPETGLVKLSAKSKSGSYNNGGISVGVGWNEGVNVRGRLDELNYHCHSLEQLDEAFC